MKFQPGQNQIVVRQGLSSTTYIKDSVSVQITPSQAVDETPTIEETEVIDETPIVEETTKSTTSKKKTNG